VIENYLETFDLAPPEFPDIVFTNDQVFFTAKLDIGSGRLPKENMIALFHFQRQLGSIFQNLAIAKGEHHTLPGASLWRCRG
jgi:hypothetical protein